MPRRWLKFPQQRALLLKSVKGDAIVQSSIPSVLSPLMAAFKVLEGLNTITRRGVIGTSTLVFGLRPMRSPFERTTNEPKEDSLTVSPRTKASQISSSTDSTRAADSLRESPTRR